MVNLLRQEATKFRITEECGAKVEGQLTTNVCLTEKVKGRLTTNELLALKGCLVEEQLITVHAFNCGLTTDFKCVFNFIKVEIFMLSKCQLVVNRPHPSVSQSFPQRHY